MSSPARLTASSPVLLVRDVVASADHYRDALGFTYDRFWGEPPSFVILKRDGMFLMLAQAHESAQAVSPRALEEKFFSVYFWVNDVEALYQEFVERGAKIDFAPCDQPHGCREFGIQDPDGYDIVFGQPIA